MRRGREHYNFFACSSHDHQSADDGDASQNLEKRDGFTQKGNSDDQCDDRDDVARQSGLRREINSFVRARLTRHLQRRSQRPFRPPEGETYYKYLQRNGLIYLSRPA